MFDGTNGMTDLFPSLSSDPFLTSNGGGLIDEDDFLVRDWPHSTPLSPHKEHPIDNDRRSRTPTGRSPRMPRPKNPPNLYNTLVSSPTMNMFGMSPPMPMIVASPMMPSPNVIPQQQWGLPMMNPSVQGTINPNGFEDNFEWMHPKRRRSSFSSNMNPPNNMNTSPLINSTTMNNFSYPAPADNTVYFQQPMQQQQSYYQPPQQLVYNMITQGQFPLRAPKLPMSPNTNRNTQSRTENTRLVLPFRIHQEEQDAKPTEGSNTPRVITEKVPTDNKVMTEMEQNCHYFISEASKLHLNDMERVTVIQLKSLLKTAGQNATGKKNELVERVREFKSTCVGFIDSLSPKVSEEDNGSPAVSN